MTDTNQTAAQAAARANAQATADAIARVLADTHVLALKAHAFHWNVEGARFFALHEMFETQYDDLGAAMDDLAERIRALGQYAPGTSAEFAALARVVETTAQKPAEEMVAETIADYATIGTTIEEAIATAQAAGDEVSAGMLTDRLEYHQKQAWMMRAMAA